MSKFASLFNSPEMQALIAESDAEDARNAAILKGEAIQAERQRGKRRRERKRADAESHVAVLDMETDPFDSAGQERIAPFAACLASDHFEPVEIWDENPGTFIAKVMAAIEALPGKFTIYAHNGGKFDYLFLIHKLRGSVSFKGRGIMAARIGQHEIRDSFHILPEKLAAYRKDDFDYEKMRKGKRHKYKSEITTYLRNDCFYLLDFVKAFIAENGLKLSIGQAAVTAVRDADIEVENINERMDTYLRQFYFGGRVECLEGMGEFNGVFKLYDVNSMYPAVMADRKHPVGRDYIIRRGAPGPHTYFIDLSCDNDGAFVCRDQEGNTVATKQSGRFCVSIYEYQVALKYGLIQNVKINYCVDNLNARDFAEFVVPKYQRRQEYKRQMKDMLRDGKADTQDYLELKIRDILTKFYLNNAYGKYAQNPRRYKESYISDYGQRPGGIDINDRLALEASREEWGPLPIFENAEQGYAIWEKPVEKLRFKNVGTSASITGAARAVLLEAICNSSGALYCDTDSLICRSLSGVPFSGTDLGAWDEEDRFDCVRIAGKKLYACQRALDSPKLSAGPHKIASKGVCPPTWQEFGALIEGESLDMVNPAPTFTRRQSQSYVTRTIRATARGTNRPLLDRIARRA